MDDSESEEQAVIRIRCLQVINYHAYLQTLSDVGKDGDKKRKGLERITAARLAFAKKHAVAVLPDTERNWPESWEINVGGLTSSLNSLDRRAKVLGSKSPKKTKAPKPEAQLLPPSPPLPPWPSLLQPPAEPPLVEDSAHVQIPSPAELAILPANDAGPPPPEPEGHGPERRSRIHDIPSDWYTWWVPFHATCLGKALLGGSADHAASGFGDTTRKRSVRSVVSREMGESGNCHICCHVIFWGDVVRDVVRDVGAGM
ncbi:hypothetical protein QBC39DRAFT_361612 [Podospora conica]|nr:hypothetical protein QBC39DRAFT_361612 [Schizothecium conicum]